MSTFSNTELNVSCRKNTAIFIPKQSCIQNSFQWLTIQQKHVLHLIQVTAVTPGDILGAFAKLRKATISFAMSIRPSVRMEQLGSQCKDFHKI
jgi:hypothetical protein